VIDLRRRLYRALAAVVLCLPVVACGDDEPSAPAVLRPPALGPTTFIDPDILTETDTTSLSGVVATGQGMRTMFDRRVDGDVTVDAYLFDASFDDGLSLEIQVNPEFGDSVANELAQQYAASIGRLPNVLRRDIDVVWVHDGVELFGGGEDNLLIHVGQAVLYYNDGFLEEALAHQAAHTSLDADHAGSAGWLEAQTIDNGFISEIAQESPTTEDVAESFLPYLAVVYGQGRVTDFLRATIVAQIPARLTYFDAQGFDLHPLN